jgi:IS5 family transposase
MARIIPWTKVEQHYAKAFKKSMKGQKPASCVALGALIIQQRQNLTDRETVEQIREKPYLQYFIGFTGYQDREPFHHSLMTHFRKRLYAATLNQINEWIAVEGAKQVDHDDDDQTNSRKPQSKRVTATKKILTEDDPNQGTLVLDATCALQISPIRWIYHC